MECEFYVWRTIHHRPKENDYTHTHTHTHTSMRWRTHNTHHIIICRHAHKTRIHTCTCTKHRRILPMSDYMYTHCVQVSESDQRAFISFALSLSPFSVLVMTGCNTDCIQPTGEITVELQRLFTAQFADPINIVI